MTLNLTIERAMQNLAAKSEPINESLWYVNPENVRTTITTAIKEAFAATKLRPVAGVPETIPSDSVVDALSVGKNYGWNSAVRAQEKRQSDYLGELTSKN